VTASDDKPRDPESEKRRKIFEGLDQPVALLKAGDSDAALEWVDHFDDREASTGSPERRSRWRFRSRPVEPSSSGVDPLWEEEERPYRLREEAEAASGGIFSLVWGSYRAKISHGKRDRRASSGGTHQARTERR
jgi:hypothetical protein